MTEPKEPEVVSLGERQVNKAKRLEYFDHATISAFPNSGYYRGNSCRSLAQDALDAKEITRGDV